MLKFGNEVYRMGWGVSSKGHKMDYSIILCELNRKISQISCKYGDRYAPKTNFFFIIKSPLNFLYR